jgi:hypothetical protein
MILTAFSGQLLASMVLNAINDGKQIGSEFTSVVRAIALTVPSTISASWLNWIIFRFTIILPWNYLLQGNTFLFYAMGLKCCSRLGRSCLACEHVMLSTIGGYLTSDALALHHFGLFTVRG